VRRAVCTLWLAALAAVLAACGRDGGAEVPPPESTGPRIVVLSPALAVTLCDLGLRDRIVGRHGYDMVLDPSIPVCGQQSGILYETLLRVRPTHVLTDWGAREWPEKLVQLAGENGWTLRDFRLLTLDEIDGAASALGEMFPGATPSERVAALHTLAANETPDRAWRGRVLLLMSVSPIAAIGPGSAHHELLERAGGVPAIDEGAPYMRMHAEDVLRIAPDAIILLRPNSGGSAADSGTDLGAIAGLGIPAVRDQRVAVVEHPLGLLPSSALADVAAEMRTLLEQWADE
jgi:ABC-type hemin transport system substrate-binding protein